MKRSPAQKQADRVLKLLNSNALVVPSEVEYEFGGWHVGMILAGNPQGLEKALRRWLQGPEAGALRRGEADRQVLARFRLAETLEAVQ